MKNLVDLWKEIVSLLREKGFEALIWIFIIVCAVGGLTDYLPSEYFNSSNALIVTLLYWMYVQTKSNKEKKTDKPDFQKECAERFAANANIRIELARLRSEIQSDRVYIMEFHNGKSNAGSSLPFLYVDMTYEEASMQSRFVNQEYQNLSTSIFEFPEYLASNGWFVGSVKSLENVDVKIAHRLKDNGVEYCAAVILRHGDRLLGVLGVSFNEEPQLTNDKIMQTMSIYAQTIGGHLMPQDTDK